MSADNFLGIVKITNRKFIGRGCFSECERLNCKTTCENRVVFTAKSYKDACEKGHKELGNDYYEYGMDFIFWL